MLQYCQVYRAKEGVTTYCQLLIHRPPRYLLQLLDILGNQVVNITLHHNLQQVRNLPTLLQRML